MSVLKKLKIKRELKNFQKFKNNYKFEFKKMDETEDGSLFCDGECLRQGKSSHIAFENDKIVNAGYISKDSQLSKVLSNLFPYKFEFKGYKVESAEAVFQSLKIKDKKAQRLAFSYSGFNANRIRACADYDWRENQIVYFQGKPMAREGKDYQDFLDELYVSLLQNKLFVNALKAVRNRYIVHSLGNEDKTKTLLSRYEFEFMLNSLKDYVLSKNNV